MAQAKGPPFTNAPSSEISGRGIEDDHGVSMNRAADVAGARNGIGSHVRVERADDAAANPYGRPLDRLPVGRVDPEAEGTRALVPRLDERDQAAVINQQPANFAKVLRQSPRARRDRANILPVEDHLHVGIGSSDPRITHACPGGCPPWRKVRD